MMKSADAKMPMNDPMQLIESYIFAMSFVYARMKSAAFQDPCLSCRQRTVVRIQPKRMVEDEPHARASRYGSRRPRPVSERRPPPRARSTFSGAGSSEEIARARHVTRSSTAFRRSNTLFHEHVCSRPPHQVRILCHTAIFACYHSVPRRFHASHQRHATPRHKRSLTAFTPRPPLCTHLFGAAQRLSAMPDISIIFHFPSATRQRYPFETRPMRETCHSPPIAEARKMRVSVICRYA